MIGVFQGAEHFAVHALPAVLSAKSVVPLMFTTGVLMSAFSHMLYAMQGGSENNKFSYVRVYSIYHPDYQITR